MDNFLSLLQNALWQQGDVPKSLTVKTFKQIRETGNQQTVFGLIADALVRNNVQTNDDCTMLAMAELMIHQRQAKNINRGVAELAALLNEAKIEYIVFKGQTIAALYPKPELRTAGDIDFYVPAKDFQRAKTLIQEQWNVDFSEEEIDKHLDFERNEIRYEMHYRTETFGSKKHQRYFDQLIDNAVSHPSTIQIANTSVNVLPPTENLLLVFKHLFNHLLVEGVGLRQFCDLAILLNRHKEQIDASLLQRHLHKIGYWRAFKATESVLEQQLALPVESLPYETGKIDNYFGRKMTKEIFKRGNFGKFNRKENTEGKGKSIETARIAFAHCCQYFWLAPKDILCLIPKRIKISLSKYFL